MRQFIGGPYYSKVECPLTGTSRRQQTLPRVLHNHEDTNAREPLMNQESEEGIQHPRATMVFPSTDDSSSKCVFTYEDKYIFSRIISGTDLLFDSHFESGNLHQAFRKKTHLSNFAEYDLILNHDVHSIGHTQWFYFSVSNVTAGMVVKFNVGTFSKRTSLFSKGMRPLLYSEKSKKWRRFGCNISYVQVNFTKKREYNKRRDYVLTFTHQFEHSPQDTKYYIAYSYPYTYSDLQDDLRLLQQDESKRHTFRRAKLCNTLAGNRCDVMTITEQTSSLEELNGRKGIIISARVHPGETVASWICRGIMHFLTSDCEDAKLLRRKYVFKVIPMLNPDGVINGNYR